MKGSLPSGDLVPIPGCYIRIGGYERLLDNFSGLMPISTNFNGLIPMKQLPDISDTKSASYPDENAIGRSTPFKSFQSSENRSISWTAHFIVCKEGDQQEIFQYLRAIESCTYPVSDATGNAPYLPPNVCYLKCGALLGDDEICTVMKTYSVKFDTSVPWDMNTFIPYKMDVDMQFDVVYNQSFLPGAERILVFGY